MKILVTIITMLFTFLFAATPTFAYTVKDGDTLSTIASEYNLTLAELTELNPQIKNIDLIFPGETIHTKVEDGTSSSNKINYSHNGFEIYPIVEIEDKNKDNHLSFSDYEIDLLARLVRAEAQTEPFNGKVAVACVVLNRVESTLFPNTIKQVIYQPRQFQPVSNGQINKPADAESIAAVKAALTDQRHMTPESLFFYNPTIATSRWLDTRETTISIGQHVFKK